MKCTVLPDTNVVIAASIYDVSDVFNTVVVEPHHEESKLLLDALLDADSGCRCVVSPTVAGEGNGWPGAQQLKQSVKTRTYSAPKQQKPNLARWIV